MVFFDAGSKGNFAKSNCFLLSLINVVFFLEVKDAGHDQLLAQGHEVFEQPFRSGQKVHDVVCGEKWNVHRLHVLHGPSFLHVYTFFLVFCKILS